MEYFAYYLTAFTLSMVFVLMLRRPALTVGLVDHPGGRKRHAGTVPVVGGLTMFLAFLAVVGMLWPVPMPYGSLIAGMAMLVLVGLLDDRFALNATSRLSAQFIAAVLMVWWGGVQILAVGDLFGVGPIELGMWAVPFTIVCVLALVNAVNMSDGADGLAGGLVMTSLLWLGIIAAIAGVNGYSVPMLIALACAVAGFLVFNLRSPWRRKASVFMGDSGSMMLGFALAWFAVYISQAQVASVPPVTIAWILALPIYDVCALIIRRVAAGRSPFQPGRDHIHHIFMRIGFRSSTIAYLLILFGVVFGAIGLAGWLLKVPEWMLFAGFLMGGLVHLWFTASGWRYLKRTVNRRRRVRRLA